VDESGVMFTVDLHWDLFSYSQLRGCADGAVDWAWSEARFEPDHPLGPLWELPEEAMLAFLATHAILDHRFRLILFRDLVEAARRGVDWGRLEAFARRWQLRSTSYLSLLIASRALGAPIDEATLDRFRPDYAQLGWVERLLSTTDLVRFDGHRAHPLNLAVVTSHDRLVDRVWLTMTAPGSFPRWRERVRRQFGAPLATQHRSVVHVLPRDLARGAQTYARALSDGLNPSLNSVTVAMYESEPAGLGPDIGLGLEMGRLRRAGFDPRVMLRLRRLLRSMNPDVVIAHGGEPLKYCAPAVPQSSALVYYKIGSSRALLQNPVRRTLHKLLMGRADLVAAVSPEMVDEAENFFGVPAEKCVYIPNGRDPEVFAPGDNSSGAPVVFVFVGHLARTKRPDVFLRVMAALRDRGLDVKGIVVGDGPMMERVKSMATAEIELLGTRDDVPSILARSDVFVFPSVTEGEGMPGVVIEAGLAGLPVVATRVPGISTVVADGETGFLVDVEDFAGMVDAAERLALDPDLRHALGHAARYRCEREFGLESSIGKWKDVLHALIDRQRSRVAT
jgi:glycosyltransferase involved in cell wall biosynthesis